MSGGRTKKAVKNISYNFINQFLNLILAFVSRTVFIHTLGVQYLGLNGLFSDVLGLLSLADLGFNTAMVYSFYQPLADGDYKKMAALTTFYQRIYRTIAVITGGIGVILTPLLPYIVNLNREIPYIHLYYLISVANIVVSYLCVYKTSILTADQKNYEVVRITMYTNLFKTLLQVFVLILFRAYFIYLIVGMLCSFLNNWIASRKAANVYPFIEQEESLEKGEQKDILSNVGAVFIYKASSVLLNATDNILISVMVGTVAVGYYSNYLMLSNKLSQFYSLFFTSLTASIGNLVVRETAQKRYEVFQCEQTISCMMSCIVFPCYVILANDFISLWLGRGYVLPDNVLYAIGCNLYLSCICYPLWSYREATGLYRKTKWVMLLCGFINIVLSVLLGLKLGIAGIILASCLSRLLTYVWVEPRILFKDYFECSAAAFFKKSLCNAVVVVVIFLLVWMVSFRFAVQSWLGWVAKAAFTAVIGIAFAVIVYRKDKGFQMVMDWGKKLWKKKSVKSKL